MADFTLVGLVYELNTDDIIRIVYPTEGDWELDDPDRTLFALDPNKRWEVRKVLRDSLEAHQAASGIIGG